MNKLLSAIFIVFTIISGSQTALAQSSNNCVSFTVGSGTGCAWMCNYCADQLGTSNYYFTDGVCTYASGGCVGNPVSGKQYTCCSVSDEL
jgi:hypothetical protein